MKKTLVYKKPLTTKQRLQAMTKAKLIQHMLEYEKRVKEEMGDVRKEKKEIDDSLWKLRAEFTAYKSKAVETRESIATDIASEIGVAVDEVQVTHSSVCHGKGDPLLTCTCQVLRSFDRLQDSLLKDYK